MTPTFAASSVGQRLCGVQICPNSHMINLGQRSFVATDKRRTPARDQLSKKQGDGFFTVFSVGSCDR